LQAPHFCHGISATIRAMLDSHIEQAVRTSFDAQGAMRALGVSITALDAGQCTLSLASGAGTSQQHGYFHGGIIGAVADSAAGYAANSLLMPEFECLTAEYKINFLRPARGDVLVAHGKVVRPGKSLVVATVEVTSTFEGKAELCAIAQMTLFAVAARSLA